MATTNVTVEELTAAIQRLPAQRRRDVLLFIEYLEYAAATDDVALWQAVLAHQAYRQAHSDEVPEVYDSPEAFLQATTDL